MGERKHKREIRRLKVLVTALSTAAATVMGRVAGRSTPFRRDTARARRLQLMVTILVAVAAVLMGRIAGRAAQFHNDAAAADHEYIAEQITAQTEAARSWGTVFQEYAYALRYAQFVEHVEVLHEEQANMLEKGGASPDVAGSLQEEAAVYEELALGARRSFHAGQLYVVGPPGQRTYIYDVEARHHQEVAEALAAERLDLEERKSRADHLHQKASTAWFLIIPIGAAFVLYTMAQSAFFELQTIESGTRLRRLLATTFRLATYLFMGLGVMTLLAGLVLWIQIEL